MKKEVTVLLLAAATNLATTTAHSQPPEFSNQIVSTKAPNLHAAKDLMDKIYGTLPAIPTEIPVEKLIRPGTSAYQQASLKLDVAFFITALALPHRDFAWAWKAYFFDHKIDLDPALSEMPLLTKYFKITSILSVAQKRKVKDLAEASKSESLSSSFELLRVASQWNTDVTVINQIPITIWLEEVYAAENAPLIFQHTLENWLHNLARYSEDESPAYLRAQMSDAKIYNGLTEIEKDDLAQTMSLALYHRVQKTLTETSLIANLVRRIRAQIRKSDEAHLALSVFDKAWLYQLANRSRAAQDTDTYNYLVGYLKSEMTRGRKCLHLLKR